MYVLCSLKITFIKKSCKLFIYVDWGRKCEGHVIISNLITYSFNSVASNLSGQKSWISAFPFLTEGQAPFTANQYVILSKICPR